MCLFFEARRLPFAPRARSLALGFANRTYSPGHLSERLSGFGVARYSFFHDVHSFAWLL